MTATRSIDEAPALLLDIPGADTRTHVNRSLALVKWLPAIHYSLVQDLFLAVALCVVVVGFAILSAAAPPGCSASWSASCAGACGDGLRVLLVTDRYPPFSVSA